MGTGENSRIETLVREKMGGKSYSTIRDELKQVGMSDEEINILLRQVDEKVLNETVKQGGREKIRQWYRIGLFLALIGLILSVAYNAGMLLRSIPAWLAYSPFFAGIVVMIYSRTLQRRQSDPPDDGTGPIRKRRPYK
jgi:hypothetical protein